MKKHNTAVFLSVLSLAAAAQSVRGQLALPPYVDGSDGPLIVTNNMTIDLGQAVTGVWTNSNAANAGKGVYDPNQWVVVFKYSSVVVASGATVTFTNRPGRAPVAWLVNGDVTINVNGKVSLDGQSWSSDPVHLPEPGPGGFRGGYGSYYGLSEGQGFGPGGGSFNSPGASVASYGNPQLVPLIGGSGGGGDSYNGGAGGGAILIAASGNITVNGSCEANGGTGYGSGGGGGGAIRLVANQILGSGSITAEGGGGRPYDGWIRLEALNPANPSGPFATLLPQTTVAPLTNLVLFPDASAPTVRVLSVSGIPAPSDPTAALSVSGDDIAIGTTSAIAIRVQTTNFPTNGGTVSVLITPLNGSRSLTPATFVNGDSSSATWQAIVSLPVYHSVIQAEATVP